MATIPTPIHSKPNLLIVNLPFDQSFHEPAEPQLDYSIPIFHSPFCGNDYKRCKQKADENGDENINPVCRVFWIHGYFSAISKNRWWNYLFECYNNTQWDQEKMIQISNNGNRMQELIYGTEGISNNTSNKNLGVPRDPRILVGQVNGIGLHFELTCSSFPDIKNFHCYYYPPL
jgi:hypothetical protein